MRPRGTRFRLLLASLVAPLIVAACSQRTTLMRATIDQCGGYTIKHTGGKTSGGAIVSIQAFDEVKSVDFTVEMLGESGETIATASGRMLNVEEGTTGSQKVIFAGPPPAGGWPRQADCTLRYGTVTR